MAHGARVTSYPFVAAANDYGRRKGPALALIVHMAEGGGTVGFLSRPNARGVSVHFVIERTGRTVQMLREDRAAGSIDPAKIRKDDDTIPPYGRTAAVSVLGGWADDPNSASVSVEIEGYATSGPNTAQHDALRALVADLRTRYPSLGLLGHRDFADYKRCPGHLIEWDSMGGHGAMAQGVLFEPIGPANGTYRVHPAGTNGVDVATGDRIRLTAGYERTVYSRVRILGGEYKGRDGYLGSRADRALILLDTGGTYTPRVATEDCDAKLAASELRIQAALDILGG